MLVHYFQVNTRLFRVPFISTADSDLGAGHVTTLHNTASQQRGTEGNNVAVSGSEINKNL